MKKNISTSTKVSLGAIVVMLIVVAVSSVTTGIFFSKNSIETFYSTAGMELSEFSDTIDMFFSAKKVELNVFSETDAVKSADDTIHSFVNEKGTIQILGYEKSPTEAEIRKVCKNFASNDVDIAEIYLGTKWGGYATNFDSSMSGGYDPRKRGWYATATSGNGKAMITDAFASTVGATVVGITKSVYDFDGNFIGNSSIEVSLDTLTKILGSVRLGEGSFLMMVQKDGTILADTKDSSNNFKNISDLKIDGLKEYLDSKEYSGDISIDGTGYFTQFTVNPLTDYKIVAFCPKDTVLAAFYKTLDITIIVCLIFLLGITVIVFFITRRMMSPLNTIIASLKTVAENDFTHEISVKSHDELGVVADTFNNTLGVLRNTFGVISNNTNELDSIGNGLAQDMNNISNEINKIANNIVSISEQSASLNESVSKTNQSEQEISTAISRLNESSEAQKECVDNSKMSAGRMINNISEISNSIQNTSDAVESLLKATDIGKMNMQKSAEIAQKISEASGSLKEASDVIMNVASKTNLLAMNAAIEASHAGTAGQGFAVVASEIRNLAEQSSKQGNLITQTLTDVFGEIESLTESTKTVEGSFAEIYKLSENVSHLTEAVHSVMGEHEESCQGVLSAINEIETATAVVKKESDGIFNASRNVSDAMLNMSKVATNLSVQMQEMESGARRITESTEAVNGLSQNNKTKISELAGEINKFKIN
ncbi:MAG: methyl-accepting chemotaxis protein [Treponema sp.]|nr:methyl-accepting chemotaxis protein [Treponema sp.]